MWHALAHFFGLTNASGGPYLFWSGVGSDISELAFVGAFIGAYRHVTCHQRWCGRLAKHQVGPFRVCRKHHPGIDDRAPTAEDIAAAHQEAL